ncbi:DUF2971 domain-containing protein [Paraburkholderia strydomiana]|uniref:DUF2971 domain-containing protein n=1 Tax=Paraburkholderia strydomiana TaxID=1245417 RepID=UPI0038BDF286
MAEDEPLWEEELKKNLVEINDVFVKEQKGDKTSVPPEQLYHYTNIAGLQGIIQSSRLWATNTPFLNDAGEHRYACSLLRDLLKERRSQTNNEDLLTFYNEIEASLNAINLGVYTHFIACLCTERDLLSQWRAYGAGGGYAIGFDPLKFNGHTYAQNPQRQYELHRVIYEPTQQKSFLRKFLKRYEDFIEIGIDSKVNDPERYIDLCSIYFVSDVDDWLISFKNSAFAEENEWRLIVRRRKGENRLFESVRFRAGKGTLVPYCELDVTNSTVAAPAPTLPITEIMIGPSPAPDLANEGIQMFMQAMGYNDIPVIHSSIPLR